MDKKIKIINRTDIDVPHIVIKNNSNNSNENETSTVEAVRKHLLSRHTKFKINISPLELRKYGVDSIKELPSKLVALACTIKRPFICNDYDYLQRSIRCISCRILRTLIIIQLDYEIEYLTTYSQEEIIDDYLEKLFRDKNLYAISKTEKKIKFAYDYIVATVSYDNSLRRHSAYDALLEKKAVCEGCSLLFYRFMAKFGVPCRIITGKGFQENHAWNIVKLGNKWFNIDVTWDLYKNSIQRSFGLYNYFLVGESHFKDHKRDEYYESEDFKRQFPVSMKDY